MQTLHVPHAIAHTPRIAPLDRQRIAAISGAIAINGLLLALLVAPMSAPRVVDTVRETITTYVPAPPRPVPPPPRPDPIRVKIEAPQPAPAHLRQATPAADPPPVADPQAGDIVVPPSDTHADVHDAGDDIVGPPDAVQPLVRPHLAYASNPAPPYPRDALRDGIAGTVVLEVLVGADGRPLQVTISRSSGHRELDVAARRHVLAHWTFKPAMRNGQPVQAIGLVPIDFSLE